MPSTASEWARRTSARGSPGRRGGRGVPRPRGVRGQSSAPTTSQPASTAAPTTSAAPSADVCSAATEFQEAANALVDLDATQVGTDGVKQALQDLETAGSELAAAAEEQFAPQVAELETRRRVLEDHHRRTH